MIVASAPMFDFKDLETFLAVAGIGSFRRAAERLNTTQPAVSQRIAGLEPAIGAKLLDRTTRRITPTPQGRALIGFAERMLQLRAETIRAVADPAAVSGTLRIGASETIVHTWLSDLMRQANERFPRLSLEIEVDISPRLLDRLMAREIDLALMVGPVAADGILTRPLVSYPVAFLASAAAGPIGPRATVADLARLPVVTFSRGTKPYEAVEALLRDNPMTPVRLHATSSLGTAVRLALDGIAIAAIPPAIVAAEIARGDLAIIDTTCRLPDVAFVASWVANRASLAVESVIDMAVELAAAHQRRPLSAAVTAAPPRRRRSTV
jgi:DNA-binding transcriptional LysR family regulator